MSTHQAMQRAQGPQGGQHHLLLLSVWQHPLAQQLGIGTNLHRPSQR